jgi:DnaJ-class molecular chaperone
VDFYVLLGLERSAPLAEIKRAYKRLARQHHPDINPGDRTAAVQFRQIAEAYETLSDPDRRRRYDAGGEASAMTGDITVGFTASTFGERERAVGVHVRRSVRGAASTGRPEGGAGAWGTDLHYHMSLGFEEAARGGRQPSR